MSKTTDHKEGKATVKIYYKVSKTLADGSHPFLIRITKDRKQVFRSTGLSLHPKYWNPEKEEVRRSYPEPQRDQLVRKLREWEEKYQAAADVLALTDEPHDAEAVLAKAIEERKATRRIKLLAYIEELAAGMKAAGQVGNSGVYRDLRNQLLKFITERYQVSDLGFDHITVAFCHEWEHALRVSGIEEITLSLRFRTLRAVLNKAIASGNMKAEHYPFARTVADRHKFSIGKFDVSTTKRAVPREDIARLEALEPETPRLRLAKNVFLFSFYCGGINFVDLAQLQGKNIVVTPDTKQPARLHYIRQKTGQRFSLKLVPPAAAIISDYQPDLRGATEAYIFPILDPEKHQTTTQIKNRLHKVLGQVNKDLKELAQEAGITTPLTTYVARHSFATSLKQKGIAIGVISEAMGHSSESVTAIYLDSFASDTMDEAFDALL